jgi:uncharacterized SAM-binding protein YcdF (DUF218 family)
MSQKNIPYYVTPPKLSRSVIDEITKIIFDQSVAIKPCDIIFIFGGSHPGLWENGAKAFFNGLGQDIIVTGGYKPNALRHFTWQDEKKAESEVIRRELIKSSVPEEKIFIETQSTNTYENVRYALRIYDFKSVSSVLVICKSYAVGRQIRTLKAQLDSETQVIPYPFDTHLGGDGPLITKENWMEYPESQAYMFANVLKIHKYSQFGHLIPIEKMSNELKVMVQEYFAQQSWSAPNPACTGLG